MSSEWCEVSLDELADINPRRTISKGTSAKFIDMAALPINGRDIDSKDVILREFTSGGAKFKNGDTLLARITPCLENGKTAHVSCLSGDEFAFGSTEFIVLDPKSVDDSLFLYYLARSEEFRTYAISRMEGTSGRQRVPNSAVSEYRFLCPPPHVRSEIGQILGRLDDRIRSLRETNATLEAIAQALFKSWFVDFDPVHANAGTQAPSLLPEIQALFPATFTDAPQGLAPEGWEWSTIAESFILTMGQSPPGDTYNETGEGLPFYQGRTDYGFRFPAQRVFCNAPTRLAQRGDSLVSVRAPVGDVNIALENCAIGRGVAGVRHPSGCNSFVFYSLKLLKPYFEHFNGEGTVFGSINKKDFQNLPVIDPKKTVLDAFEAVTSGLDAQIENNELKLRTLTSLRDTLLPRLISGQLRLPDAEQAVEEFID